MPEIHLSQEDRDFVEAQVKTGVYKDADAVVSAGLRLLGSKEGQLAELQRLVQAGLDDVEAGRLHQYASGDELLSEIRQMAAERAQKTGTGH
ncbi:type II toxin-antitoxin system ParD family antitoxin [Rhizobium sp. LjRoot30]|uniref:type II toxin-antitoxin system ParD family antitoxin n=1 Tax=Rhizobium sp. LjRoot30 TaxID=3342320 RepID=UPI003ED13503